MEKEIILNYVEFNLDFERFRTIKGIQDDLDNLEYLGATHLEIEVDSEDGITMLKCRAFKLTIETDEGFEIRKAKANHKQLAKIKSDYELYEKLKARFEPKKDEK